MNYISELKSAFRYVKREGNNVRVGPCPRKDICDGSKTVSVNLYGNKVPPGTFRCWQCEWSGSWNKLAKEVGMKQVDTSNDLTSESERVLSYHNDSNQQEYTRPPRSSIKPWRGDWRNIPEKLLKKLNAELWIDVRKVGKTHKKTKRLMLPVMLRREEVGYIGARIKKNKEDITYKNSSGEWVKRSFYPYDFIKKKSPKIVCLVEGPHDMLNLLAHDIPVLMFFGVNNWHDGKLPLLVSLGIDYVIPLGDNDKAGRKVNDRIEKDVENDLEVIYFDYEADDPGKMKKKELKRLKRLVDKYND